MINSLPPLLLGICFWLLYVALLHLWRGRSFHDLIMMLVMGGIGFGFGQVIGSFTAATFLRIGELHLLEASLGAWLLLGIVGIIEQ